MDQVVQGVLQGIDSEVRRVTQGLAQVVAGVLSGRLTQDKPIVSMALYDLPAVCVHYTVPIERDAERLVDVECRVVYDIDELDPAHPGGFFFLFFDLEPKIHTLPEISIDPICTTPGEKDDVAHLDDHGPEGVIEMLKKQLSDIEGSFGAIEAEMRRHYACGGRSADLVELVVDHGEVRRAPWA